jgi:hypothetical protein
MNEHAMYCRWLPLLYTQQGVKISAKIQEFSGYQPEHEKWMAEDVEQFPGGGRLNDRIFCL